MVCEPFNCLGSNQFEDLGLYPLGQASLPRVFSPRSLWFLNDKNHSLLTESLILGLGSGHPPRVFFLNFEGLTDHRTSIQRVSKAGDGFKLVVSLKNSPCRSECSQVLTDTRSMSKLDAKPRTS